MWNMKILLTFLTFQLVSPQLTKVESHRYTPEWDDLDSRPLPKWYDEAKIGIFLHWGVYSVPSFGSEWFWSNWKGGSKEVGNFMEKNYPPGFSYQEFAPMFTAEFFDPEAWAKLFYDAGAKYIVLTSKHHEGYTLFPSKRSFSWNAMDIGPKRDLVEDLADAVRKQDLKFGLYHSLYEWFNPIYEEDKATNFTTRHYVHTKLWPDLKQIVNDYQPSVIWADGDWEAYDNYWRSQHFLAWLYNDSPVKDEVVVNDRWGIGTYGKHGDFYNFADRHNPGKLIKHKWENAFTIDKNSWGYRRTMTLDTIMTIEELLEQIVSTVSCGGNALIDVGPTKEGTIPLIFQDRLLTLGKWLAINGEAIYNTTPWQYQKDVANDKVWYTRNFKGNVKMFYAIFLQWPRKNTLKIKDVTKILVGKMVDTITLLGNNQTLNWQIINGISEIELPDKAVVVSQHAWVLRFTFIQY